MNMALEVHDSTLDEIKKEGASAILHFSKAIIHRSEKEPGVDKGTCWFQSIEINLEIAHFLSEPEDIPNQLDYGYFFHPELAILEILDQQALSVIKKFEIDYHEHDETITNEIIYIGTLSHNNDRSADAKISASQLKRYD